MKTSWLSRHVARVVAGPGPATTEASARAIAADLRTQAARAPKIVEQVAHLDVPEIADVQVEVVSRLGWVNRARDTAGRLLTLAGEPMSDLALTAPLALAARKVLGQFDPFSPVPRLALVAPNIAQFQAAFNLDRRDLALWVSVHELTHAAQFAVAPWLGDVVISRGRAAFSDKAGAMDDLSAVMSLLEGHAQYVMNAVPASVISSRRPLQKALATRRSATEGIEAKIGNFLGFNDKLAQYERGEAFVAAVVAEVGLEGFNRVWENPLHLPLGAELDSPDLWLARV
ncbi:uncharacterized protein (DUF2342 family) [Arcanobacterium wilhelmae]|uniref:Uncharacterized protein (DUF2342 family) n=1 Tax=Arcanobacterium wilhelmae TaxID=1803177 RepID=A0ABT9NA84_9ACTO|nr:zinc-dependent metalloprotease [Arcanobacterium wilhelmae]MDP9800619.1 uncharacterized protein (DUF2342 family) [Arcanobacterium wilhelmae]WFN90026.1 zinc-dependent metalloprotease [Arcanobacterium wilhelmae]